MITVFEFFDIPSFLLAHLLPSQTPAFILSRSLTPDAQLLPFSLSFLPFIHSIYSPMTQYLWGPSGQQIEHVLLTWQPTWETKQCVISNGTGAVREKAGTGHGEAVCDVV